MQFNGTSVSADVSGNSFGVAGLYHFNPQGSYSPFVKLGLRKIIEKCKAFLKKANGKLLMKTTSKPHLSV
jgi:hypothetical protein